MPFASKFGFREQKTCIDLCIFQLSCSDFPGVPRILTKHVPDSGQCRFHTICHAFLASVLLHRSHWPSMERYHIVSRLWYLHGYHCWMSCCRFLCHGRCCCCFHICMERLPQILVPLAKYEQLYLDFFTAGILPVTWSYSAEIQPLRVRNKATAVGVFAHWMSNL